MRLQTTLSVTHYPSVSGAGPFQILRINQQRYWVVFSLQGGALTAFICTNATAKADSIIDQILSPGTVSYLRKDLGSIVTGELWLSDGNGGSPIGDLTVTEGIILSGS